MLLTFTAELQDGRMFEETYEMVSTTYDEIVLTTEYFRSIFPVRSASGLFLNRIKVLEAIKNKTAKEEKELQDLMDIQQASLAFRTGSCRVYIKNFANKYKVLDLPKGFGVIPLGTDNIKNLFDFPPNLNPYLDWCRQELRKSEKIEPKPTQDEQEHGDDTDIIDADDLLSDTDNKKALQEKKNSPNKTKTPNKKGGKK